jgi:pyruvate formate lyase activating enzyme
MKKADFYKKLDDKKVQCLLCPHQCIIQENSRGICKVRKNFNGELISENYGKVCSMAFDPIEKKPLYHYFPGRIIFSVGNIGCNLNCQFCQNWQISQSSIDEYQFLQNISSGEIVTSAKRKNNIGIAYTYNEPTVWFEFMLEIAKQATESELKNVMVTNGFINPDPLEKLLPYIDAFSVDLKAFTNEFYKNFTFSEIEAVKKSIKKIHSCNKHLEITNLVVTDLNDNKEIFEEMVKWISGETGRDTVLHISRYYPTYKLKNPPTSVETLIEFHEIAKQYLDYVYLGNVNLESGNDTICCNCGKTLIKRKGYFVDIVALDKNGDCEKCGEEIVKVL